MDKTNQDYLGQLSHILTIIPKKYIDTLLTLFDKLDNKEIKWVVNGDLAERLRIVKIDPELVEIVTSKNGAEQIFDAVHEFNPQQIDFVTQRLARDAVIASENLPLYERSNYFEFKTNNVLVKVHGDLQFKVGNWQWGEIFDFNPEYVYVTGKKIAVTPLPILFDFYQMIGWTDRAEKIAKVLRPIRTGAIN